VEASSRSQASDDYEEEEDDDDEYWADKGRKQQLKKRGEEREREYGAASSIETEATLTTLAHSQHKPIDANLAVVVVARRTIRATGADKSSNTPTLLAISVNNIYLRSHIQLYSA
jgi:hypothetical protein